MAGFRHRATASIDMAMVAHPSVTLLIGLGEAECAVYDAQGRREGGSVVIGLLPGDLRAAGQGVGAYLQIRLQPVVAAAVFGASSELSGQIAMLEDVWGRDAGQVEDRLRAAATWDERFAIAAEILGTRMGGRRDVDPEVAHTWRRTFASRGRVRVEGMADEVGWSRKRLWSRFRSQLGITPKRAAQLVRFDHAAHLLAGGHSAASAAILSGYVDQSHLHREVKTFTGLTPTALAATPWLAIDDVAWPREGLAGAGRRLSTDAAV
ncbi:AraC family transcriptional regulator [Actinomadura barringtoniae]|uniref:AraC family transcriptional regulator n=2 Tax=Actinomadura barringtoniae TaxID=1427535 RepID=A0A939PJ14_9ACTN|nr:AraC family transcriptional regulator [Actinomadura barringtoniae]